MHGLVLIWLGVLVCAWRPGIEDEEPPWSARTFPIGKAHAQKLEHAVRRVLDSVPSPGTGYVQTGPDSLDLDEAAPVLFPARATVVRHYTSDLPPGKLLHDGDKAHVPIRVRASINGWLKVHDVGPGSETPTIFPMKDAIAVEIASGVDSSESRPAEMTIILGDQVLERSAWGLVHPDSSSFRHGRMRVPSSPSEIRHILVRIRGPKSVVEKMASRFEAAPLRSLLGPFPPGFGR